MERLANEIRLFLIEKVSRTGGHLASNLGVVELTLALHKVFSTPRDKIIWDVGHQSYVHKIITGRRDYFDSLRQFNGIAGFPKVSESSHDCFNTGHSSTSISAAFGFAKARDIKNEDYSVVAVIGDGALTGGMSFEALNNAGRSQSSIIVILNDNEMSISKNVGSLSSYLSKIRTEPVYFKAKEDFDIILSKIPAIGKSAARAIDRAKDTIKYLVMPGVIFEEIGFKYLGPIEGHDIVQLTEVLTRAKKIRGPVLIHVRTQKGKGYTFAEKRPQTFHGISPFEIETGEAKESNGPTYSQIFGGEMIKIAESNSYVVAITAAMPHGTGLDGFQKRFPSRFFDVGIAEQHAVTFAAGLAQGGLKPVVAVYSSFLQRAYDQILHDVALQNLHVVFAIDRAGIVGEDGETHHGIYDISYLSHMPNMTIVSPSDYFEFRKMLEYAVLFHRGPIAIRYPRGNGREKIIETGPIVKGKGVRVRKGSDITLAAAGNMVETALDAATILEKSGISAEVINARFIKPLDAELFLNSVNKTGRLATIEDNVIRGGFGSSLLELLTHLKVSADIRLLGFPDEPITHGSSNEIYRKYKLDSESIAWEILGMLRAKK
jgi:1-deoxy-D-xylulose-5-phosphate synthase